MFASEYIIRKLHNLHSLVPTHTQYYNGNFITIQDHSQRIKLYIYSKYTWKKNLYIYVYIYTRDVNTNAYRRNTLNVIILSVVLYRWLHFIINTDIQYKIVGDLLNKLMPKVSNKLELIVVIIFII